MVPFLTCLVWVQKYVKTPKNQNYIKHITVCCYRVFLRVFVNSWLSGFPVILVKFCGYYSNIDYL